MREVYDSLSWSLLAAAPEFEGGIFDESVILVLEDAPEGSYGIMLNRPKGKLLADLNTGIDDALLGSLEVFDGGPVSENKLTFAVWKGPEAPGPGNFAYGLSPQSVKEQLERDPSAKAAAFAGYAGWGENQLHTEIDSGYWITRRKFPKSIFETSPERMWETLLLEARPYLKILPELNKDKIFKN